MRDIYPEIDRWTKEGQPVALATVVKTWGSAPRTVGAKMAVNKSGDITGSVSGGCVEGAVVAASMETLKHGKAQFLHFDVADEDAWEVGVACGGEIDVFVRLLEPGMVPVFQSAIESEDLYATVTVVAGNSVLLGKEMGVFSSGTSKGSIDPELDAEIIQGTLEVLPGKTPAKIQISDSVDLFVDVILPAPTLVIVGGVHIAVALVKIAKASGYRVVVVDPRRQFGTQVRFPDADQLIQKWPDEAFEDIKITPNTAVAMLTHDPKIDDPGLHVVLPSQAFYVGALGSRKTQQSRRERLRAGGMAEDYINRIHGPIGLDLGGRSPEEIALAIMAEVVQQRYASSAGS